MVFLQGRKKTTASLGAGGDRDTEQSYLCTYSTSQKLNCLPGHALQHSIELRRFYFYRLNHLT